jgi:hypothetical protein
MSVDTKKWTYSVPSYASSEVIDVIMFVAHSRAIHWKAVMVAG